MNGNFWITVVLPVALLAVLGWVLPHVLAPRGTRSHRQLARAVLISAVVLVIVGAALFAALRILGGGASLTLIEVRPFAVMWYFLIRSAYAVLIWGPILALSWYSLARQIEDARARDIVRQGRG
ncbi:hypothetical protein [Celeribacter arenosi]|uniref:Uncharacterized protein n=1 Tax=Celeribacter arenosi TaxID=792649 RepID=A0ABP7K5T9_9RHOB